MEGGDLIALSVGMQSHDVALARSPFLLAAERDSDTHTHTETETETETAPVSKSILTPTPVLPFSQLIARQLSFTYNLETNRQEITVTNKETGDIIRQIPETYTLMKIAQQRDFKK